MALIPKIIQKQLACVLLLVLSSTGIYFNSLKGSFQFDDVPLISSPWIENLDSFNRSVKISSFQNRPVLLWTYALNNTLGKNKEFGFHLVNLLLHIGVALLIFFSVLKTSSLYNKSRNESEKKSPVINSPTSIWAFPLITALIFSLHPLNTDSVSYISSRSSVLATFFYLFSLYIFLSLFSSKKEEGILKSRLILIPLIALTMYLSLASKLIAATLPLLMIFWYSVFIFSRKNLERLWTKNWAYLLLFLFSISGLFLLGDSWLYNAKDQGLELYGRWPYLLIQIKVIVFYYLKLFIVPFNLSVDSGMPFSSIHEDPYIILALLIILGLIVTAIKSRNPWFLVGTAWFFITLAPTSSFMPLNDLAVEHRTYLPMTLGLCMVVGWGISRLHSLRRFGLLTIILIAFSLATITRNGDWVNEISLWEDVVRKNPTSSRAHNNLGKAYFEKSDLNRASYHFEKSIANIPKFIEGKFNLKSADEYLARNNSSENYNLNNRSLRIATELVEPHYNLASIYLDQGKIDLAEKEYLKTLSLRPQHTSAKIGLGSVYNKKGLFDKAEELYSQAIAENTLQNSNVPIPLAHLNLGEVYGKTGRIPMAIKEWKLAIQQDASLLPAHFNLGTAFMMQGKLDKAEKYYLQCLKLNNRFKPALFNLALVKQKQMNWQESIERFNNYMTVAGPSPSVLTQIGFNYLNLNDWANARSFLSKSLKMVPTDVNTLILLGDTYSSQGKAKEAEKNYRMALNLNKDTELEKLLQNKILEAKIKISK
ncbi:MAG: tetratricopeptide repeat protein [Nitrospinae bacterium]|nr:tetratricopeptide repeat protein [Nitrospinota bacterium]